MDLREYRALTPEQRAAIVPVEGLPITVHVGSDSYACTIERVSKTGKSFWFRFHNTANCSSNRATFRRGAWRAVGIQCDGPISLGVGIYHLDPSF